jgi:hypothetical protein
MKHMKRLSIPKYMKNKAEHMIKKARERIARSDALIEKQMREQKELRTAS